MGCTDGIFPDGNQGVQQGSSVWSLYSFMFSTALFKTFLMIGSYGNYGRI